MSREDRHSSSGSAAPGARRAEAAFAIGVPRNRHCRRLRLPRAHATPSQFEKKPCLDKGWNSPGRLQLPQDAEDSLAPGTGGERNRSSPGRQPEPRYSGLAEFPESHPLNKRLLHPRGAFRHRRQISCILLRAIPSYPAIRVMQTLDNQAEALESFETFALPHSNDLFRALRENSEKWPIGGDLSILPFQGFSTPATSASTDALGSKAVHPRFRGTPNPGCLGPVRVAQICTTI